MRAGFYEPESPWASLGSLLGLGANIKLGLIRLNGDQSPDQMSEIIGIVIRSYASAPIGETSLDYNLQADQVIDRNAVSGTEDYGNQVLNYVNHNLTLTSTVDVRTVFDTTTPAVNRVEEGARYFACSIVGVWHIVELSAVDVGHLFKINSLELTVIDAGRLQ